MIICFIKYLKEKRQKLVTPARKIFFQMINNHNKEIIKEFQDRTNNNDNNNNNNNNNNSKQNECNCKTRNKFPMNGLCSLNNIVYQGIIYLIIIIIMSRRLRGYP